MIAIVVIPSPLRNLTNGERKVNISLEENSSVKDVVLVLESKFPGIQKKIFNDNDNLHNYINIFLEGEDIRYLKGIGTQINDGEELSIVPAVAGGY